jgi:hypothetical protein
MNYFKNWLTPPAFGNDVEKTITAGLLNSILLTLLVSPVVFSISALFVQANPTRSLLINSFTFCVLFGLLLLLRNGYVKFAAIGTVIFMFLIFNIVAAMHKGINSPAFSGLILVVLVTGLFLVQTRKRYSGK